jgi:hypothetical protein
MHENAKIGLEKARLARIAAKEAGIPVERKNPLERLATNPTSLRLSINAKCYDCMGQDQDPGIRQRIGTCHLNTCGLWHVRPYQKKSEQSENATE